MVTCYFYLYRFPISGVGKLVGAVAMFCALLVVAFPITILSMNMVDVYEKYRTEKTAQKEKITRDMAEEQAELIKWINEEYVKSVEHVDKIRDHLSVVLEQNEKMRESIRAIESKE